MMHRLIHVLLMVGLLAGCTQQVNPSFNLTEDTARAELVQMHESPVRLQRPLVILGGFADVGLGAAIMQHKLTPLFDHPDVLTLTFADCTSFEQCRKRVLEEVGKRFGDAEVDVIGQSMGGLIAVYSATDLGDGSTHLNAARIFTLSSPLRGAKLAENAPMVLTDMHRDMLPGSLLYQRLSAAKIGAQLYCYTLLADRIVGERFASLDGRSAWWADTPPLRPAHFTGITDDRIVADISRRLRGESAYATYPQTPLPERNN